MLALEGDSHASRSGMQDPRFEEVLQELLHGLIAQTEAAPEAPGGIFSSPLIPFALIFAAMYFFILRPQQKQQKEQQAFLSQLKKGDEVLLQGGMFGKIQSVGEFDVWIELAPGLKVRALKSAVSRPAPTALAAKTEADKTEKKA